VPSVRNPLQPVNERSNLSPVLDSNHLGMGNARRRFEVDAMSCHNRPADRPGDLWHKYKAVGIASFWIHNEAVIFEIVNSTRLPFIIKMNRLKNGC
jgi:hypothetical protein